MKISIKSPSADLRDRRAAGWWLLGLAAMVYLMVVLGGLTRLSGSGLSMTEWQPFTLLPPMDEAGWQAMFAKYRDTPQYLLINQGMGLAAFKSIFWLEYIHRLWGRLMGLAFVLPGAVLLARGQLDRRDLPRLLGLLALGGLQGLIGWLMVKSGLVDRPEVSPLRLALHLSAALAIYAALLWSGLGWLHEHHHAPPWPLRLVLALAALTIPAGALVAGTHAGLIYNSFPLMDGAVLPAEAFAESPWWSNFFANPALVQFDHRVLAISTWSATLLAWAVLRRRASRPRLLALLPLVATAQAGLGIATLLMVVPLPLAAAHQAGAFLLFGLAVWAAREV
jgi:cytochrome c oxidase assembly protein subunit 15